MHYRILESQQLIHAFHGAKTVLENNKVYVDSLNVFPVPDGDTGTNMHLTVAAAVREMDKVKTNNAAEVLKALAGGALMGARGNSGVILSQLFRGFSQGITQNEVDPQSLAEGFEKAAEMAYRSVIKPVEGTILTVAKEGAKGALAKAKEGGNCLEVLEATLYQAQEALDNTPKLLPVLADAGVVDAGGQGFVCILQGMLAGLKGEDIGSGSSEPQEERPLSDAQLAQPLSHLEFRYCTELIIKGENLETESLKGQLLDLGDSLLVVGDDTVIKLHIHTNSPGLVLQSAEKLGVLYDIKIDNMEEQHNEMFKEELTQADRTLDYMGVVAVTVGEGLSSILKSLGVDVVILGGQTMNPSTQDLMAGVEKAGAKNIILMPNNKNIILTAEQVQVLAEEQGIEVAVVPTKNFPQCISALLAYNPEDNLWDNQKRMAEAATMVKAGEITFAVRDSQFNGLEITKGEILGLADGEIAVKGSDLDTVAIDLLEQLSVKDFELLSIFYGEDVEQRDAEDLRTRVEEEFSHLEVEVHSGGQPLYYYIFGLE